jgi:phosphoribosylformylglycinamidine synthase
VVAVRPGSEQAFAALAARHGVPAAELGVAGGDSLVVQGSTGQGSFDIPVDELAAAHSGTLPALFG